MLQKKLDYLIKEIEKSKNNNANKKTNKNIECKSCRYDADDIILRKYIKNDITEIDFNDRDYVYHISTLINSFYSTRMGADRLYATAMKIANNGMFINKIMCKEKVLSNGELDLIQDRLCEKIKLRATERGEADREFRSYSFVTKFLSIHSLYTSKNNISSFPIYDGQVVTVIKTYKLNELQGLEKFIKLYYKSGIIPNHIKNKYDNLNAYFNNTIKGKDRKIRNLILENYGIFYKLMEILSLTTQLDFKKLDQFFWKLGDKIQKEIKQQQQLNKKG